MKKITVFIIFIASFGIVYSSNICDVEVQDTLDFGNTIIRSNVVKHLTIQNNGNSELLIKSVKINTFYSDFIHIPDLILPMTLQANEEVDFSIILTAKQNININGMIFFQVSCHDFLYSVPVYIKSHISLSETDYRANNTDDKWGGELADSMSSYFRNHTSFSYKDARKLFWGNFDKKNGLVECIYTGKTIDPGTDPDFAALDGLGFNTEHTWPKSLGAENEPTESDINHLFVTDKTTNDKRANYPFGFVTGSVTYENGGSKLGKNAAGNIAFEVRDKYKGNVARALFYFALRYGNPNNFLNSQENDLRQWINIDSVDSDESTRNDSVAKYQKRSNLLIQYPELFDRMPSISQKTFPPYIKNYFVSDSNIVFDLSQFDATAKIRIWLTNFSNKNDTSEVPFMIEEIDASGDYEIFSYEHDTAPIINQNEYKYFDITCYNLNKNGKYELHIKYSDQHTEIIYINAVNGPVSVRESFENKYKVSNSPNPADFSTKIKLEGINSADEILSIKVYDILSGEIADLTNNLAFSGSEVSVNFAPQQQNISGQIYYLRFELKNRSIVHPVLFLN